MSIEVDQIYHARDDVPERSMTIGLTLGPADDHGIVRPVLQSAIGLLYE